MYTTETMRNLEEYKKTGLASFLTEARENITILQAVIDELEQDREARKISL